MDWSSKNIKVEISYHIYFHEQHGRTKEKLIDFIVIESLKTFSIGTQQKDLFGIATGERNFKLLFLM